MSMQRTDPVAIGTRRELFVDSRLIADLDGVRRRMHRPDPRESVLTCDRSWETGGPGYPSVIDDGERYRLYYRTSPDEEFTCYAHSDDGIAWRKPSLGLVEYDGSRDNNIVWDGPGTHNFTPFYDTNPSCRANERYKAVGGVAEEFGGGGLQLFTSPDGIDWELAMDGPLSLSGNFDSQNVVFWDAQADVYRAYWRDHRRDDPYVPDGRDIKTATSVDLQDWSEPRWLIYRPNRSGSDEPDVGDDPTGDHHQLYTNGVQPYHRAPHILLGFPARYSDRGWTASTEALPDRAERRNLADQDVSGGRPTRLGTALWDTLCMASRNGTDFEVWPEAFVRPGIQRPGSWFYGQAGCALGMVETPSTYPDAPPQLSLFVQDNARVNGPYRLRRHTLRIDGFASMYAPLGGGTVTTIPVRADGNELEVNFSTSAGGRLRVELQDAGGDPIPGFEMPSCDVQYGDELARTVSWNGESDVSTVTNEPIRLQFLLKDADLYAMQFR